MKSNPDAINTAPATSAPPTRASRRRTSRWPRGTTYKEMVSECLQDLVNRGNTHAQIGAMLGDSTGPVKGNVVSMHMYSDNTITAYPVDRLPQLSKAVGLKPIECLKIFRQRSINHPKGSTAISTATVDWFLGNTLRARRDILAGEHHGHVVGSEDTKPTGSDDLTESKLH